MHCIQSRLFLHSTTLGLHLTDVSLCFTRAYSWANATAPVGCTRSVSNNSSSHISVPLVLPASSLHTEKYSTSTSSATFGLQIHLPGSGILLLVILQSVSAIACLHKARQLVAFLARGSSNENSTQSPFSFATVDISPAPVPVGSGTHSFFSFL